MKNNINLVEKLEEQAQWHNKLMLYYLNMETEDSKQQSEHHAVASMSYLRAAQMARVDDGQA